MALNHGDRAVLISWLRAVEDASNSACAVSTVSLAPSDVLPVAGGRSTSLRPLGRDSYPLGTRIELIGKESFVNWLEYWLANLKLWVVYIMSA